MLTDTGRLPTAVVACVGGGSNAIGIFAPFYDDPVRLVGVEAAGRGLGSGAHAASLSGGRAGGPRGVFRLPGEGRGGTGPGDAFYLSGPGLSGGRPRTRLSPHQRR